MEFKIDPGTSSRPGGISAAGKGCMTVFFLIFLAMGSIFTIVIIGEAIRETAVWFWPEVPCTILASGVEEIDDDSNPYQPSIHFSYQIDGRDYEGHEASRGESSTSNYDSARWASDRFPSGSRATCRVNPEIPGDAVLEARLPWIGLVVFFPLIFVAVGGGGIYAVWKGIPRFNGSLSRDSISQKARRGKNIGRKLELGIGLLFAVVGGALSIFLLILPVTRLLSAISWEETPATINASSIRSWSTDDGTSYRADVLYNYTAEGREWISNRRGFFPMASSDYEDAKATVDRYPVGSATTCFVDTGDPTRSTLNRSFTAVYFIGLFPLVFLLAGVGLTAHARRTRTSSKPDDPPSFDPSDSNSGVRHLEPAAGPVAKVVGMVLVAALWNGIVSVFVWQAFKAYTDGSPDWFLMVFLIPFVLVGLALIIGVFYTFLGAFNPRPMLTISPAAPRLGTTLRVEWSFRGQVNRIDSLEIVLEGFEKATYRRGTDTHTDREAFASIELVNTSSDWEIARGSTEVAIPEDTMHSFTSANNGVEWSLYVHGDIARWPDVEETFVLEIRPLSRERLLP
jgi:hypothetical protein